MPHWGLCVGCVGLRLSNWRKGVDNGGSSCGASKGSCHINNLHASAPGRVAAIVVFLIVVVVAAAVAVATADIILYILHTHSHTCI